MVIAFPHQLLRRVLRHVSLAGQELLEQKTVVWGRGPAVPPSLLRSCAAAAPAPLTRNSCYAKNRSVGVNAVVPFHQDCWVRHFGGVCVVCAAPLPAVARADGSGARLEFLKHPFFDHERMCSCHAGAEGSRTGC